MNEEKRRWQRVREAFQVCLELPEADRDAHLVATCGDDPEMLAEARDLLRCHEDPQTLLPARVGHDRRAEEGVQVERYELLELVGQGGMGVVYRARRADGIYDDEVAVKLLHGDLHAASLVQRFGQERQILASLKHPAIARLIDGGTASDGRPFLVMEYVDGVPIDRYCASKRLDVPARLALFAQVCRAVHSAHQSLVVHRDLKPANLLVDASGAPRLLDFGVAKLIDPTAPALTAIDADGTPMTPDYASPEQVSGEAITTATDVYGLGAVLYLLLTGSKPLGNGDRSLRELVDAVCHIEPAAPSERVANARRGADGQVPAERAGYEEPQRLRRILAGDLDRVVAMAMSKVPARRYASAEDLARDVDRYLAGRPVQAREPTAAYRLGKFLRRHRWPCLAATLVAVTLTVLGVSLLRQRNQLLQEQTASREVTGFLEGLFLVSTPEEGRGRAVLARELLDRGALDVRVRFADQPRLRTRLMSTMGRAYLRLGHVDEARPLLEASLEARRARADREPRSVADGLLDMGDLRLAEGNHVAAEAAYVASQAYQGTRSEDHDRAVRAAIGIAQARQIAGDYDSARAIFRSAVGRARTSFGTRHERVAEALRGLGELHRITGDLADAEPLLEEALDITRERFGDDHPAVARLRLQIGLLLEEQGRFEEAEAALRETRRVQAIVYPEGHPLQAETLNNLASVVLALGRAEEAETLCRDGLSMRRDILEQGHPAVGESLNLLGLILARQGRADEAEQAFRAARALWRDRLGPDHVQLAAVANNLSRVLRERGDTAAAEEELLEALRLYTAAFGDRHVQVATVLNNLALMRKAEGDLEAARDLYDRALAVSRNVLGETHPRTAVMAHNLGVLRNQMAEPADAEPLFRIALAGFTEALPASHPNLALVRKNLAETLLALDRDDDAEACLREALAIHAAAETASDDLGLLKTRGLLAELMIAHARYAEALTLLEPDLAIARQYHGTESEIAIATRTRLERAAARQR